MIFAVYFTVDTFPRQRNTLYLAAQTLGDARRLAPKLVKDNERNSGPATFIGFDILSDEDIIELLNQ